MSRRLIVPPEAVEAQRRASDPALSAWVAANAGSGKTYVLARRVVRLMLAGTPPGAILCLTFTKAAAATMANRVFGMLGDWALLDDARLAETLAELDGARPTPARLLRARRLFAEALETPGGLKVQTIHAFCERVLHQFPFEANVASQFTVLDDRGKAELVERAKLAVLLEAAANPDGTFGKALAHLSVMAADQTVAELLAEALGARDELQRLVGMHGSLERAMADLGAMLGLMPGDTAESVEADIIGAARLPSSEWSSVAAELEHLSSAKREREVADLLRLAATDPLRNAAAYVDIFFTKAGEPRKDVVTKAVRDGRPELAALFEAEKQRLSVLRRTQKALALRDGTAALLTLAHAMADKVETEKAARGALDFDDLVARTRALFTRVEARWILYKLDQGIDHILVDEAQDTSPDQWDLVTRLVEEFTAGEGARAIGRTLFVVGDEKQSIYSFQGADPRWFGRMRRHFERSFSHGGRRFESLNLTFSFRSTPAVLGAVDKVFEDTDTRRGLTADGDIVRRHEAARSVAPGLVELWPPLERGEAEDRSPWTAPLDALDRSDPVAQLAGRIAQHIRLWLDRGHRLPDKAEPVRAGDILILVRRRGALFEAIIRALKNARVPVAGADRLVLGDHIAVMDLLALADCLLTPEDDLSLAAVLKSPLIGMSEEALLQLAANRPGSLWDALQASGHAGAALLARWRQDARDNPPATFYGQVLSRDRGRRKMLERLGSEAADAIDEFLSMALAFETTEIPTLRGFVAFMRSSAIEVKRDMEMGRDEVRVMTVHGAKGLEADIVFLADTMAKPGGSHDPKLFRIRQPEAAEDAPRRLVWSPSAKADVEVVAAAREESRANQAEEYRRLLYVAMTRAADKLVVCGARPALAVQDVWYDMIERALGGEAVEEAADDEVGTVKRWRRGPAMRIVEPWEVPAAKQQAALPAWLLTDAPAVAARARPVTPSGFEPEARRGAAAPDAVLRREAALRRGSLTHRLLQSLPEVPDDRRQAAAVRFLERWGDIDAAEREAIAADVMAILRDPAFAPLFGSSSRPEVPIVGSLGGRVVSGQIDRLVVEPHRIVVADYKTNDPAPRELGTVPEGYVTQLAIYRALLSRLHGDRPIEAWLVWTAIPAVMVVPAVMLDDALKRAGLAAED
jgi:ATP-dependent helicase/nuclease subunit A